MEQEQTNVAQYKIKNLAPIVMASVLASILVAGGSVYAYQKSQNDKQEANLQTQITVLQQQLVTTKAVTVTPEPIVSATPIVTATPQTSPSPSTTATPVPALTASQLMNATYTDLNGKSHTLKDGTVTYPALGGDTGEISIVQDVGPQEIDLNGDGVLDSILILRETDGGTGSFYQLASVLNLNGKPAPSGQHLLLEDRATVKNLTVDNSKIIVSGLVHGANQSSVDMGDKPKTETYKWVSGKLISQ